MKNDIRITQALAITRSLLKNCRNAYNYNAITEMVGDLAGLLHNLQGGDARTDFMSRYGHIVITSYEYHAQTFHGFAILPDGSHLRATLLDRDSYVGPAFPCSLEVLDPDEVTVYSGHSVAEIYVKPSKN